MADPYVRQARGVIQATIGSTSVVAGDAVYFDGTDWELADADDNTKFAEAIACNSFGSGEEGAVCRSCVIVDTDAPYTQGGYYYLSATAGSITATRPTGAVNLKQVLGFALSTSELYVDIPPPKEITVNVQLAPDGSATSAYSYGASSDFGGVGLLAANDAALGSFMVPENCIGMVIAYSWHTNHASAPALDASDTMTVDVSAGVDDETNTATTDGMTSTALTVADNDLARVTITTALDATGIIEPGNVVGIDILKDAEGAGADDPLMMCCSIVLLVV